MQPHEDLPSLIRELEQLLQLHGQISERILRAAVDDPDYAFRLYLHRGNPEELARLIADPPEAKPAASDPVSSARLLARATKAVWRWAQHGFEHVSEEVLARRENACLGCTHLSAPETTLQQLAGASTGNEPGKRLGNRVCGLCGCSLHRKIRMISETCPCPAPGNAALNRWGEPVGRKFGDV